MCPTPFLSHDRITLARQIFHTQVSGEILISQVDSAAVVGKKVIKANLAHEQQVIVERHEVL
ncbi:hypothetical protein D3C84_1244240 [compost metagenome]